MSPKHYHYLSTFIKSKGIKNALLLAVFGFSILWSAGAVQAQSLDVRLDSGISSGILVGSQARELSIGRSPFMLDIDAAFIFDGDESVEWVLGTLIQAEYLTSYAINPQVRLRRKWKLLAGFAGFGIPFFLTPYTRFGTELSLGVAFPAEGPIALIGHGVLNTYFLGSDLSDGNPMFTMNGVIGIRARF